MFRRLAIVALLLLATTHCVLSIFYVNHSYIDLHAYAHGAFALPYQGRLGMIPVLRWAESSHALAALSARYGRSVPQPEPMTAMKLVSLLAGLVATCALGGVSALLAGRLRIRLWWLPWTLIIIVLYASYGARYEQPLWYPYDLPHLLFFGLATLAAFLDEPWWFLAAFVVDTAIRETALFLLPFALAVHPRKVAWRWVAMGGGVVWIASRMLVAHLFPAAERSVYTPLVWLRYLAPWHLPQVLSLVGFLPVPVLLGRRYLEAQQRRALYVACVIILISFYWAIWDESRVWCEWTMAFAVWAAWEIEAAFGATPPRSSLS